MKHWNVINRFNRNSGVLLLLFILSGCSSSIAPAPPQPLQQDNLFHVYSQITIRQPDKDTLRLLLLWQRYGIAGDIYDELEIKNILGTTQALLNISPDSAVLIYPDRTIKESNASTLAKHFTGLELPVSAFGYWINGTADHSAPAQQIKTVTGAVSQIQQHGWTIDYGSRTENNRPQEIALHNGDDISVEISIRQWIE